jgi:hypothetical protein
MKQWMGMVIITGFLVVTADLEAVERRLERVSTNDGRTPKIALTNGPQLLAVGDFGTPPPAPATGAVPPGPMSPEAYPAPVTVVPMPEAAQPGMPGPLAAGGPPLPLGPPPVLYSRVKYKDRRHIAPCAVPMYVAVRDPCERHDRGACGPPKYVMVEICVPPGACPKITYRHDGDRVRYDYGKYAVNITSRHGVVFVNYDR